MPTTTFLVSGEWWLFVTLTLMRRLAGFSLPVGNKLAKATIVRTGSGDACKAQTISRQHLDTASE